HAEGDRVGPRRSEREIDELKHRFEILARSATAKPLLRLADVGSDRDPGAGENLVQVDALEIAETALSDDLAGGFSRDEVLVAGKRRASRTHGPKQDFVLLERGRLEHDPDAVGQMPFGDAQGLGR